jgi:tetratricopeptide (TPR) repeat protein
LDPGLASAYGLLGISQMDQYKANYKEGISNLIKALEINPHDAEVLRWSNFWFANSGNMKAADEAITTLREIDPLNPMSHFWFGWNHFMNGRFGLAVDEYEICVKLSPGQTFLLLKAMMLAYDQREDEVLAIQIPKDQVHIPPWNMISALQCAIRKDLNSLNQIVQHMQEIQVESDNRSGWWIAEFYAIANDLPNVLKWLEIAMEGGWINHTFFSEHDIMMKKFRGNPPFDSLLEKMRAMRDELWRDE